MNNLLSGKTDKNVYLVAYDYHTGTSATDIKNKIVEINTNGLNNTESKDFMLQESLYFIKSELTLSEIKEKFNFVNKSDDFIIIKLTTFLGNNIVYSNNNKNKISLILGNQ